MKSGRAPILYDLESLRACLGYNIDSMRQNGFDASIIEEHKSFNEKLEDVLGHTFLNEYLRSLTPQEVYLASGVRILTMDAIKEEIQQLSPGAILFPHGYLPIASSIGGNIICFHVPTNQVVWADHDNFGGREISFENRETGTWEYVSYSAENIKKAVVPLAASLEDFLSDLLSDKLEKRLDELD
jgi:hypothetical protein